jgi:hypothetical protein
MEVTVALLTLSCAVAEGAVHELRVAVMPTVPAPVEPTPVATPPVTVALVVSAEAHVAEDVTFCVVPSVKFAVAVKVNVAPTATLPVSGLIERLEHEALEMTKTAVPDLPPNVAVMVAVPAVVPGVATPVLAPTVAMVVSEDVQVACVVTSPLVPLL